MVSFKYISILTLAALATAGVTPRYDALAAAARIVEKCGDMGVMDPDSALIPKSVDKLKVRVCEGHPRNRDRGEPNEKSPAKSSQSDEEWDGGPDYGEITPVPRDNVFEERACWFGDNWGCSGGYCWTRCGSDGDYQKGYWCWLAWTFGYGDWVQCRKTEDCEYTKLPTAACGRGCVVSQACGCSC